MSRDRDDTLLERLQAGYAPEPLSPARAAAFERRLRERVERAGRRDAWRPAAPLILAASAALVLLAVWLRPVPERSAERAGAWELELLFASDVDPRADQPEANALPDDYRAIASLWLDG
jgi:hypothetical protein